MGSSTGNMLVDNEGALRELFSKAILPVTAHCEDEPIIRKNSEEYRKKYGEEVPINMHPLIRSRVACFKSSSYAVRLALEFNTRLHILHLSTADEMKLFSNERPLREKRITGEVCVHHLWFEESSYEELGTLIKWNPAIKTRFDRDALISAVNNDRLDIIATDHAHILLQKRVILILRHLRRTTCSALACCNAGTLEKETDQSGKIIEKMCHNPAILFNIKDRGFIRVGYKADLCLVDPHNSWIVSKENILYKCGWSPLKAGIHFESCKDNH